jgi:hypothetical protein
VWTGGPLWTGSSAPPSSVLGQLAALPPVLDEEGELGVDVELLLELDDSLLPPLEEDSLLAAGVVELSALRLSVR